jgi:hypothetical protein
MTLRIGGDSGSVTMSASPMLPTTTIVGLRLLADVIPQRICGDHAKDSQI